MDPPLDFVNGITLAFYHVDDFRSIAIRGQQFPDDARSEDLPKWSLSLFDWIYRFV